MTRAAFFALMLAACGGTPAPTSTTTPTETTPTPTPTPVEEPTAAGEARFEGTITEANFGCAVDAICELVVDSTKRVRFGHDTRGQAPSEWGDSGPVMELMQDPAQGVGKKVSVYAAETGADQYTLKGKTAYFIKIVN